MFFFESDLLKVKLLKRYKRFLVEIEFLDGAVTTAYCPNPGSMKTCFKEGWTGYVSKSKNNKRKLVYTLELVYNGQTLIGVHPIIANEIVYKAILNKKIKAFNNISDLKKEQPYKEKNRIDLLGKEGNINTYIEIKSVSMVRENAYAFPDSVTVRGQKQINELIQIKKQGHRAGIFFLIFRNDGKYFEPAWEIDPVYSNLLLQASKQKIEIYAYEAKIFLTKIDLGKKIKIKWNNVKKKSL